MIVRDLEVAGQRLLLPIKTNLSVNRSSWAYCIRDGVMEWDSEPILMKCDDFVLEAAVQARNPLAREHQFEKDCAAEWLHERLSQGRVAALVVQEDAGLNEICYSTLRTAFRSLGCKTN